MKLIRYQYPELAPSPFGDFDKLFERAFSRFGRWNGLFDGSEYEHEIAADLYEDEANYYARFELPGIKKKEIDVELENAVLTVSGEHKTKEGDTESAVKFSRSVSVPDGIHTDKITAKFEDGLLTVAMPKMEARKPKAITVK